MSVFDWIDQSVQLECDGLELYSGFLSSYEGGYLRDVRQRIESHGMTMPMMCYSPDFTLPDPHARKGEIDKQIEIIRVTAELGGAFCRTLSGQRQPELLVDAGVERVAQCIEACLPEAEACGVKMVLENHYKDTYWEYPEFAQKMDVFCKLVDRIQSPWFGVQYDPSNAVVAGDDAIALLDAVLPRVLTMHASDRYLAPGATLEEMRQADGTLGYSEKLIHGVTGKGFNDYDAILIRLTESGFDGWISIEDGMNGMEEMRQSVEFLKAMRDKYA